MEMFGTGPFLIIAGYGIIYISLFIGCRVCQVREANVEKIAQASLAGLAVFAVAVWWLLSIAAGLEGPASPWILIYVSLFLVPLITAPWFLRTSDGGDWGRAWSAAAVGGIALCILCSFAWPVVTSINTKSINARATAQKSSVLASYGLPYPASARFSSAQIEYPQKAFEMERKDPDYKRMFSTWTERWPCEDVLSFSFTESPSAMMDNIASSLEQAGFTVRRSGTSYVTGAKYPLFVVYAYTEVSGHRCMVRVWKEFAAQMETVCAAEMRQN